MSKKISSILAFPGCCIFFFFCRTNNSGNISGRGEFQTEQEVDGPWQSILAEPVKLPN